MNKLLRIILCIGLVSISSQVFAQIQVSPLLKFENWSVAIIGVRTDNYDELSDAQKEVSTAVRPILSAVIKEVTTHYLSTEEKRSIQRLKKTDALSILNTQLETLQNQDDQKALENEKLDIWDKRLNTRKQRRALAKRIKKVEKTDTADIDVPAKLDVSYIEQTEYFSISNIENFREMAVSLKAHSLIYYQVYPLEGYSIIEIFEYNILTNRSRRVLRTIVDPKNIFQIYKSFQLSLHSVILGTESAELKIKVLTKDLATLYDAKILLNGDVVGFGEIRFAALPSGTHVITILYELKQRNEIVILNSATVVNKNYFFDIEVKDLITITSTPNDAKVYVNNEWVGNSPVVIPKPNAIKQIEIRKIGYITNRITLDSTSDSLYNAIMEPTNPISLEDRIELDRRKFYNSFGVFAISLVVPLIFNGFYVNETNAHNIGGGGLSPAGQAEYELNSSLLYYAYIGTSVISTGLGVFTFVRLRKYLSTASEYHER